MRKHMFYEQQHMESTWPDNQSFMQNKLDVETSNLVANNAPYESEISGLNTLDNSP